MGVGAVEDGVPVPGGAEPGDLLGHEAGLLPGVLRPVEAHGLPAPLHRAQGLLQAEGVLHDHGVGEAEDGLGGAVVLLQAVDPGLGVVPGEVQDVLDVRRPEGVDPLVGVAHGHEVGLLPGEKPGEAVLDGARVLVLVHVDEAGPLAHEPEDLLVLL